MIAELFYPKELKEVIKDLREKDDLNEEALKTLNWIVDYIHGFLMAICIFAIFLEYQNHRIGMEAPILSLLMSMLASRLYLTSIWKTYMASYLFGRLNNGSIISYRVREMGSVIFQVQSAKNNKCEKIYAINPMNSAQPSHMPKKGEQIEYYCSQNSHYSAVPNISGYMKKCCLKKSMIEGVKI